MTWSPWYILLALFIVVFLFALLGKR